MLINNDYNYLNSIPLVNTIESVKITKKPAFNEQHVTLDEGDVKEIRQDQIATYPNVNSCFTITAVLSDGNMVGAHLVSAATDDAELKLRKEKGIKEPNQILSTMREVIGKRKIKELIVAGSLHESQETTGIKKVPDKTGKTMIEESYTYKTNSWKTKDILPEIPIDAESEYANDGANMITAFIACYFESALEKYEENKEGVKAQSCITEGASLITVLNEKEGVKVNFLDQEKFDKGDTHAPIKHKLEQLISDESSYEAWIGAKEYLGWGSI